MSSPERDTPARTLAESLRRWSDDQLAALLRARPDLATPPPHDSSQLASRAATRSSLMRALDDLDQLALTVLEALVVVGGAPRGQVVALVNAAPRAAEASLDLLLARALAWQAPGGVRALSGVADALGTANGIRRRSPDPLPTDTVRARLAELSPKARALLEHVDAHGGEGHSSSARRTVGPADARTPVEELISRRLLLPRDNGVLVLPGEVAVVLRGGRTTSAAVDVVPELATSPRDQAIVDRTAAGAAFDAVRRVELLLDHWSTAPPGVLRSGGLGVRDLKAAARELHVTEAEAALLVELAWGAGLLAEGPTPAGDLAWLPTDDFDAWTAASTATRWSRLVAAWWDSPRVPSLVGTRDGAGKAWNALSPELASGLAADARHQALAVLSTMAPGQVLATGTGDASVVTRLQWLRPRRPLVFRDLVVAALQEAAVLCVTGAGGVSTWGHLVVDSVPDAAEALAPHLPQPVDHVLLQADLTAVAPGPLETELARTLHLLADVESRGGATVHRFSASSVRRAFDAGWSAQEVRDFVTSVSRTPVPQPLEFLIDDVARSFGAVRVGHAESFVRADDEAALAAIVHDSRARTLGLRLLAPTVVISTAPIDVLLPRLREMGVAPVVEAPDGTVRVARPDLMRARRPRGRRTAGAVEARKEAQVHAVVSAIRAGDRAGASRPAASATTPSGALSALREAIESGTTVVIGYVDAHGATTERVVDHVRVEGGRLSAHDHRADDVREFAVHRISSVRPAAP